MRKICPIVTISRPLDEPTTQLGCIWEHCAWWHVPQQCCAILALAGGAVERLPDQKPAQRR